MAVKDYKTNPDENTTISGINIDEGCTTSGINNAIRQLMADVKQDSDKQNSNIMTGATGSKAGTSGLVPAPSAGDYNKPLTGGGVYADTLGCNITGLAERNLPIAGGVLEGQLTVKSKLYITDQDTSLGEGGEIEISNAGNYSCIIDTKNNFLRIYTQKNLFFSLDLSSGDVSIIGDFVVQNHFSIADGTTVINDILNLPNRFVVDKYSISCNLPLKASMLEGCAFKNNDIVYIIPKSGNNSITIPPGGYWACAIIRYNNGNADGDLTGVYAGGTVLTHPGYFVSGICVRVY